MNFYARELQKIIIRINKAFRIDKILAEKTRNQKKKNCMVIWVGWPDKFKNWVLAEDVVNIKLEFKKDLCEQT